eukprot:scaffold193309_cov29-Tisochrysis_lutea.AAC.2
MVIWPANGEYKPASNEMMVDLPLPEFPIRATRCPAGMIKENSLRTISVGLDGYANSTFSNRTSRPVMPGANAGSRKPPLRGDGRLSNESRRSLAPEARWTSA